MIPSQRDVVIKNLLEQHGAVTVAELCSHCNCSPETARRDLRRLEAQGVVSRTHGGAQLKHAPAGSQTRPHGSSLLEARLALVDRADAIMVTPNETKATRLLVNRARRLGIPLVAEATNYPGANTVVAVDNYRAGLEIGRWVMRYARQHLGGSVVALDVSYPRPNTEARSRGFADGLRELAPASRKIHRVNGHALREPARRVTADALGVVADVNLIFAVNDDSALGAVDAYRAAGLDESQLLVVAFGLEGDGIKELLERAYPYTVAVAMFPELVGQACVDAAIYAHGGHPLPERITTPFAIVTPATLDKYYARNADTGRWEFNLSRAELLDTASPGYALVRNVSHTRLPQRLGYIGIFSSHEWYQNIRRSMREHTTMLGINLEVIDASQDMAQAVSLLKRSIGTAAADLIQEGDTIILDGGVTTGFLAAALTGRRNITVITNSLAVLAELETEEGITVVASGGIVRSKSRALVGAQAAATFADLRADKAFLSVTGLSVEFGLSNTNMAEAAVKQAMLDAAHEVIVVADSTKIGVESLIKIGPVETVHRLVTDAGLSDHDRLALAQRGIEVSIAAEDSDRTTTR